MGYLRPSKKLSKLILKQHNLQTICNFERQIHKTQELFEWVPTVFPSFFAQKLNPISEIESDTVHIIGFKQWEAIVCNN